MALNKSGIFALVLTGIAFAVPAQTGFAYQSEQDEVYRAYSTGRILGLDEIRERVSAQVKGTLISNELDEAAARRGQYVYRLTFLQANGAVVKVAVDAATGRIMQMDGR